MDDIIKVGQASELARQQAEETGALGGATNALLNDYSISTGDRIANLRTPRTPAVQDNILMVSRIARLSTDSYVTLLAGINLLCTSLNEFNNLN